MKLSKAKVNHYLNWIFRISSVSEFCFNFMKKFSIVVQLFLDLLGSDNSILGSDNSIFPELAFW